jgi:hypothetical protein
MLSNRINRLVPPPRRVPLQVVCSAMFGITGFLGAIFLISGLGFTLVFTYGYHPFDDVRLALWPSTATGVITAVRDTYSYENDISIYEYDFAFTTKREQRVAGRSYSNAGRWTIEDTVTVKYLPDAPAVARIQGARSSQFDSSVLFVLIFPFIGAALFLTAAYGGLRQVALLRSGVIADARLTGLRPTNVSINHVPVMNYDYEFQAVSGETFNGTSKSLPSGRLGDEAAEPALYLPSNPGRSTLVDAISLSHQLEIDEQTGQWFSKEGFLNPVLYISAWIITIALSGYGFLSALGIFR